METSLVIMLTDAKDVSSNKVISYLDQFGIAVSRINDTDDPYLNHADFSALSLSHKDETINLINTKGIWLRRGYHTLSKKINSTFTTNSYFKIIKGALKLQSYILERIEQLPQSLGSLLQEYQHNKLSDLELARNFGLEIPKTMIITSSNQLEKGTAYITKSLNDPSLIQEKGVNINWGFTSILDNLGEEILCSPSLVQEKVEKEYEVRVFYLKGSCYSMAIFSQLDAKTSVDFRNYNEDKPNRMIPYNLPKSIVEKIDKLMNAKKLNTGSLDFIVNAKKEHIFLEINPVGQFDWVALKCNYPLEREIAKHLACE